MWWFRTSNTDAHFLYARHTFVNHFSRQREKVYFYCLPFYYDFINKNLKKINSVLKWSVFFIGQWNWKLFIFIQRQFVAVFIAFILSTARSSIINSYEKLINRLSFEVDLDEKWREWADAVLIDWAIRIEEREPNI